MKINVNNRCERPRMNAAPPVASPTSHRLIYSIGQSLGGHTDVTVINLDLRATLIDIWVRNEQRRASFSQRKYTAFTLISFNVLFYFSCSF